MQMDANGCSSSEISPNSMGFDPEMALHQGQSSITVLNDGISLGQISIIQPHPKILKKEDNSYSKDISQAKHHFWLLEVCIIWYHLGVSINGGTPKCQISKVQVSSGETGPLSFCRCAKVKLVSDMANPEMKCDWGCLFLLQWWCVDSACWTIEFVG